MENGVQSHVSQQSKRACERQSQPLKEVRARRSSWPTISLLSQDISIALNRSFQKVRLHCRLIIWNSMVILAGAPLTSGLSNRAGAFPRSICLDHASCCWQEKMAWDGLMQLRPSPFVEESTSTRTVSALL